MEALNKCSFCSEIHMFQENNLFISQIMPYTNIKQRIIYETDNWLVMPTIGAFVPGYLLIITRNHYISIGACPAYYYLELECLVKTIRELFKSIYNSQAIAFEHGASSNYNKSGCCIDHAHLHILPSDIDILPDIKDDGFDILPIETLDMLKQQANGGKSYIYYQDPDEKNFLVERGHVPSQYIRQIIACRVGKPEKWDWRRHPELQSIVDSVLTLSVEAIDSVYKRYIGAARRSISSCGEKK